MTHIPRYKNVNNIDLTNLSTLILEEEFRNYFLSDPGQEHYKLLGYFSTKYDNSTLLDIGTFKGCSALALSFNPTNKVVSFDIVPETRQLSHEPENVQFIVDDILKEEYKDLILQSPLILLDTFHDGVFEHTFYYYLRDIGYKGLLLLDNTKLNEQMRQFWDDVHQEKYDVSLFGHSTGTGLVIFE